MSASAIASAHRPNRDLPATVALGPVQLVVDAIGMLVRITEGMSQGASALASRRASRPSA